MSMAGGAAGSPKDPEVLRQNAADKQQRMQARATARALAKAAGPGRLRRLFGRGTK
jgi:hypothetical protein